MSIGTHGSDVASYVASPFPLSPVTEVSCLRDGSHCLRDGSDSLCYECRWLPGRLHCLGFFEDRDMFDISEGHDDPQ